MSKLSTMFLVGMAATAADPVLAASPSKSPYGETTQYVESAGGDDLLTADNVSKRCRVENPLAPAVLRGSLDAFNQGLLASATVTSSERELYVKELARNYIDSKSKKIDSYLAVVKEALDFYNNTPVIDGKYEKPFVFLDNPVEDPRSLLLRVSKFLGYVDDLVKEIDAVEISPDDKAIFEQSIQTSLDALQQVGISCEVDQVGPIKMYPGRDRPLLGYDLPSLRQPAAYTPRTSEDRSDLDKFSEEQSLRFDSLNGMVSLSNARFQKKYGI